jgi:hypothetical protein
VDVFLVVFMEKNSLASQAQADKGRLEEDLDMAHQHVFSSTTASTVVTTTMRQVEETVQHIQTATTTVNINHSGNHGNGINAPAATKVCFQIKLEFKTLYFALSY